MRTRPSGSCSALTRMKRSCAIPCREDNQQIFASRYKLYLPTEAELATELQRERQAIEMEDRLRREPDEG